MCQVFGVSRSGYYNWVQHEPSDRKQSDERLKLEIKVAHIRTRETYGTRRLQTELAENGIIVGRDRLARLRKELRLRCKQKRKFRATTNSEQWRQQFPIEAMCQVFGVSRSGYYNWVQHEPSDRKQSDERLKLEIKVAHIRTRETYGTRRLQTELAENGIIVGRDRLARLRKELRLRCKQKRKFRATTNSNHNLPVAPNLLNQTFAPTAPNQVWVADLTYVATQEGWLYLAGIKDVYTCEIVGYAMGERMTKELTGKALLRLPGHTGAVWSENINVA